MGHGVLHPSLQVDEPFGVVHGPDRAGARPCLAPGRGIERPVALLEPVFLAGKPIAVHLRPLHHLDDALVREASERAPVLDELLLGAAQPLEVPPPERLVLPAVPLEQLRQEPARVPFGGPLVRIVCDAFREPGHQFGRAVGWLLRLLGRLGFGCPGPGRG